MLKKKNNSTHSSKRTGSEHQSRSVAGCILCGLITSAVSAAILLVLSTAIVYSTDDPGKLIIPAALAALYLSSFAGGFSATQASGGDKAPGLLSGGAYLLILLLLSMAISGGMADRIGIWPSIMLHAGLFPFALLGSLAAENLKKSNSHKRRRR